jgi:hypothetical protein
MHPQLAVVVLSLVGAAVFALSAIRTPRKRWTTAVPALILLLLAIYELRMDRWEKTVSAPIRLDLVVVIPLVGAVLLAGALAMFFQRKALSGAQPDPKP